ncbi:hypothetical protein RvY_05400-2 [Ramazzottius varieornatus]|nr:hypothetical protein RvY_05400-2 [Ramazzottius varieornatus]
MNARPPDFERLLKAAVLKILQETPSVPMETDLNPSNLGTREYWDDTYSTELQNYEDSNGVDVGEIWFGFESERRIVNWISKMDILKSAQILDIGSGNGSMLLSLHKNEYTNLTGIDYSEAAVSLATKVATDRRINTITYRLADITASAEAQQSVPEIFDRKFDLCIDKGTYDAVCLAPENSKEKRVAYMENVAKILHSDGYLIVTSCNWTKDELITQFTDFTFIDELPAPHFQFGGRSGNTVTALVFKHPVQR